MSQLLNYILENENAFQSKARLQSLYSDFRVQRISNPDGYAANVSAWQTALINAVRAGAAGESLKSNPRERDDHQQDRQHGQRPPGHGLLILPSGDDLVRALETREWGRPLGLGAVVQDAIATKQLMSLKEFLNAKESIYQRKWTLSPWQVLSWGMRQLGLLPLFATDENLPADSFVVMANVESAANAILKGISNRTRPTDLVFFREEFSRTFAHVLDSSCVLSPTDITILLTHLSRDRQVLRYDAKTIKFAPLTSDAPPEPITHQDATVASLRSLINSLQTRTTALTDSIAHYDATARASLNRKSRPAALSALRSKKAAKSRLASNADTLSRLEEMYAKIEMAADQVEMVQAMEASTKVLKGLHAEVGGVDDVERVVDRLTEEMETVDDVHMAVTGVGVGVGATTAGAINDIDEAEVDDEIEKLEKEAQQQQQQQQQPQGKEREKEKEETEAEDQGRSDERHVQKATDAMTEAREVEKTREKLKELDVFDIEKKEETRKKFDHRNTIENLKINDQRSPATAVELEKMNQ